MDVPKNGNETINKLGTEFLARSLILPNTALNKFLFVPPQPRFTLQRWGQRTLDRADMKATLTPLRPSPEAGSGFSSQNWLSELGYSTYNVEGDGVPIGFYPKVGYKGYYTMKVKDSKGKIPLAWVLRKYPFT